jgi:hypothetical protein
MNHVKPPKKVSSRRHVSVPAPLEVEADLKAGRRHRASAEKFVKAGHVEDAARDAEPRTPVEEEEMFNAERSAEAHSKGEDPEPIGA